MWPDMDSRMLFRSRVDSGVEMLEEDVPIKCVPSEATDLAEQLKFDRLIKIFIGASAQPYLVQQSTLERASEYFSKSIKIESFENTNDFESDGVLSIPDGDQDVWKMLLFWLVKGGIPDGARNDLTGGHIHATQELMVKCWVAGDTYKMPDFQECAMLHLLYWLDVPKVTSHLKLHSHSGTFPWNVMRQAFQSSKQGAGLRKVFAAAALDANHRLFDSLGGVEYSPHDMDELQASLEGIPGAMQDMIEASAHDARQRNGPKAPIRYRILQTPFPWSLLYSITIGQTPGGPNGEKVLASLRHALSIRIQTFVTDSKLSNLSDVFFKISDAAPALYSKIAEEVPKLAGGEKKCEPM